MTPQGAPVTRRRTAAGLSVPAAPTEIDVARGIAVFTMSLGHSASLQLGLIDGGAALASVLTFHKSVQPLILFSGALLGYLHAVHRTGFPRIGWFAVDKALFLLTGAHLVLMGANLLGGTPVGETVRLLYFTVMLAGCMLLGSLLVPRTSLVTRLAMAPALLIGSWALTQLWEPTGFAPLLVKEVLFGLRGGESAFWALSYPILPWFSLYLAGTGMGEWLGRPGSSGSEEREPRETSRWFVVIGVGAIAGAIAIAAVPWVLREAFQLPVPGALVRFTSLYQRTPPSAAHLLLFSGIALILTAGVLSLRGRGPLHRVVEAFETLGRTWVLVFILHSYAYFGILVHWIPGSVGAWAVQCVLSLAVILGIATLWDRGSLNRFLTLGIGPQPRRPSGPDHPLRDF
jgi:uncharacterized membrane protein